MAEEPSCLQTEWSHLRSQSEALSYPEGKWPVLTLEGLPPVPCLCCGNPVQLPLVVTMDCVGGSSRL